MPIIPHMAEWWKIVLIGAAAGIASGVFGIGGGIVMVPAMIAFLGFSQLKAQGTSLATLLAPIGLLAVASYWKSGNVDLRAGGWMALGFLVGSLGGSYIALASGETAMKKAFGVFLVVVGLYTILRK